MSAPLLAAAVALSAAWAAPAAAPKDAKPPLVVLARFSGVISPVAAEFLQAAVARAEDGKADALVIALDTPGGLDLSMREIVKAILASRVPVLVYVSPAGGRAASAGVFITMAGHVAAMTPGTNIGAAHPVQLGGDAPAKGKGEGKEKPDPVMEAKITNDLAAYLQAIAARRGRNVEWAQTVVVKSTSVASGDAVRLKVVDLEAESLEALLAAVDGRRLKDFASPLRTKGARVEPFEMTQRQRLLAAVSDPNIAMILMTLGVSGLLIELYSPGLILPGIVGAVSLVLAFYSFQTLSANYAGLILIALGFVFFLLELKITSFGLLALSGTAAVIFGGLMLFKDSGGLAIAWPVLASTAATLLAVAAFLGFVAAKAFGGRVKTGAEGLKGALGVATTPLSPRGTVRVQGELWDAVSAHGEIPAGAEVVVVAVDGLALKVRRK